MNIRGLDGSDTVWRLSGNYSKNKIDNRSSLHIRARKLITSLFPTLQLLEEVPIPVRKSETLFLDFYLPLKKMCMEVHGEQHYKFIPFYHTSVLGFVKSKKRDSDKKEWCHINDISYIELPFDETDQAWAERIINA